MSAPPPDLASASLLKSMRRLNGSPPTHCNSLSSSGTFAEPGYAVSLMGFSFALCPRRSTSLLVSTRAGIRQRGAAGARLQEAIDNRDHPTAAEGARRRPPEPADPGPLRSAASSHRRKYQARVTEASMTTLIDVLRRPVTSTRRPPGSHRPASFECAARRRGRASNAPISRTFRSMD